MTPPDSPPARATARRPRAHDEVHHVVEGRARLAVGDDELPVEHGSILFVDRGVEHRFVAIEEDLTVLVFFSKADVETAR